MWRLASFLTLVALSGCSSISGSYPRSGPIIPDATLYLAPNASIPFSALAAAAVLYVVYDPLAPNWSITERALDSDTYYLSLRAKSFRTGGDGEAMLIFKRRALQLQRERGFSGYRIVDYVDGIESSTPLTHRFSEGTIQLVRAEAVAKP
jgi:hypothetical protein